jgi:hypothetical protein
MTKDNSMEVTDITYAEMGTNKYIIAVGWDRKVSVFMDNSEVSECSPVRVLNGAGSSIIRG